MSRTIFHGPKDVRAIEVRLYVIDIACGQILSVFDSHLPMT